MRQSIKMGHSKRYSGYPVSTREDQKQGQRNELRQLTINFNVFYSCKWKSVECTERVKNLDIRANDKYKQKTL